jgi:hypothetical protein
MMCKVTYPLPKGTVISSITLPAGELLRLDAPLRSGASYFLFTDPGEQYGFVRRTARTLVSARSEPFEGREVVAVTFADGMHARKFELDERVELLSIRALPE